MTEHNIAQEFGGFEEYQNSEEDQLPICLSDVDFKLQE
jgi:hypothetical protein